MKKIFLESLGINKHEILNRNESETVTTVTSETGYNMCAYKCRSCPDYGEYWIRIPNCEGQCSTDVASKTIACSYPQSTVTCSDLGYKIACRLIGTGNGSGSGSGTGSGS